MSNKKLKNCQRPQLRRQAVEDNKKTLFSEFPAFCFSHVTKNSHYNFEYFKNQKRDELEVRRALDALLEYLSQQKWITIIQSSKRGMGGYESIYYNMFKFSPKGCVITNDEKISVIRFGKDDSFRLIGKWEEPIFYVFGYDFDHSAYDHGS